MPEFSIGDSVIDVNSGRHGIVKSVRPPSRGRQAYEVLFANSETPEQVLEIFLLRDYDISDPFERCVNHVFGSHSDFARINTSYKLENSSNSTIASLKASKTLFKAYQFKPLLKFLNSENRRLLVADEVGLGKTIEAGHIMLEMKARQELQNVLIICPKSLRLKWQSEMEEKFNLKFRIFDDAKTLREDIRMSNGSFRGIINYERIQYGKDDTEETAKESTNFVNIFRNTGIRFSLVLCDEAHKMRNASTATYRGAEQVADMAKSMVFLTATPIMINDENLYNLLHLLSPLQYDNSIEFHNSLSLNQPFLEALRALRTSQSLSEIASTLQGASVDLLYRFYMESGEEYYRPRHTTIDEFYSEDPLFQRCIDMMKSGDDNHTIRAKLQYDLTSMSEMNNIFSRTRRREVTTDLSQAVRRPFRIAVNLHPEERAIFDKVIQEYIDDNSYIDDWTGEERMSFGAQLGLVTKKRQVASSVYAYRNDGANLENGFDEFASFPDAKVDLLVGIIKEIFETNKEKKAIVFAIFRKTLYYLKIRLEKAGIKCGLIVGGMQDRDAELERFRKDDSVQVLLSSEVGSEGLDMQFCCSMVNYDLPWNPMVVEQRIGRIDRFGQKSPVVKIYNLVVSDSIQEKIYDRLLMRIGIFEQSIGDLEAILDARYQGEDTIQTAYTKLEKELFYNELSEKEIEEKLDDIARAVAIEKEQIQKIEESQTNTLTVDTYFQNEVNRILTTHAYLTENELRAYIELLIKKKLSTCSLEPMENGCDRFIQHGREVLNFVSQNIPNTPDMQLAYAAFKRKIDEATEFIITFSQEVAYENPNIIFINNSHPLVVAAFNFFEKSRNANERTFMFDVPKYLLPDVLHASSYFLAIYSVTTSYLVQGAKKETTTQHPVLYDWQNGEIVTDEEVVMKVMGQSQVFGTYRNATDVPDFSKDDVSEMQYALLDHISYFVRDKKSDLDITLKSQMNTRLKQLENFHIYQELARLNDQLRRAQYALETATTIEEQKAAERRVKGTETQIANSESAYQDKCNQLRRDPELSIVPKLVSINLINLI